MSDKLSPLVPPPSISAFSQSSSCRPKRQSFSRFFSRSSYSKRRSRAVVPADSITHPHLEINTHKRRNDRAMIKICDATVHVRALHRIRRILGEFMRQLSVEVFFVMIVLLYGVFVTVQLTLADGMLSSYMLAVDATDLIVGSILLLEIFLNVFAYGLHYLNDKWALFDALVIVVSFVLDIVAAMGTTSSILPKFLKLRVILRILRVLRVLVVFERVKQRPKLMNLTHLSQRKKTSTVEQVLLVLNELRFHPAIRPPLKNGLDFAIDAIKNNRLYVDNDEFLVVEGVDNNTQKWFPGEMPRGNDTSKILTDSAADEDDPSLNLKRQRSFVDSFDSDENDAYDVIKMD
ncbi:hypothetical protein CCR75_000437 [Bremia lactucae]|uniref:Ion transport domain-containing protein n=1 Tax=Bremia lactucae TaxID=4779 RepID=A0A976FHK5_BRELC|nr:hypothetical protein CCR75_000437 [Bremia lactucae]